MNSDPEDKLVQFRKADWERQMQLLKDPQTAGLVKGWLGDAAFADLQALGDGRNLAGGKKNIVVVPGVMGSVLQSGGHGGIWWMDMLRARNRLDQLALAPGGLNDLDPTVEIRPCAIDIDYAPLRAAIARSGTFGGSLQFPYDWRKSLSASADGLRDLINQAYTDFGEPVHLVGHSMGGLMIRWTLMTHGSELWRKVGKIVFVATPHYGSASIAGYLKNHLWGWEQLAVIGAFLSRQTLRSLWGVISLLPAPESIYPGTRDGESHPCANFDMYNALAYQLGLDASESTDFQRALTTSRQFHTRLYEWHRDELTPAQRSRMLQISGVGKKTLFRLEVRDGWLGAWQDVEKITARTPGDPNREGDGRVPLASAQLENIQQRYIMGEHGTLQNLPAVVRDVLAWMTDSGLSLPSSPMEALARHLSGDTTSSSPNLDLSASSSPHGDEYDRYQDIPQARIAELISTMNEGKIPTGIDLTRIL
jgi:pimeloyl-ACP methyl ester carboxylesterase